MIFFFSENCALETAKMINIWTTLIDPEKNGQKLLKIEKNRTI